MQGVLKGHQTPISPLNQPEISVIRNNALGVAFIQKASVNANMLYTMDETLITASYY